MYVLGVDPGLTGAFVLLAPGMTIHHAMSTPRSEDYKGGLDIGVTSELFKAFAEYHPICVLENVGGRPRQSAPAAFNFGHLCGALYALAIVHFKEVKLVTPQKWKGEMDVRGKRGSAKEGGSEGSDAAIVSEADFRFPNYMHLWRGPKGGLKVDVAEAALIALWGMKSYNGG